MRTQFLNRVFALSATLLLAGANVFAGTEIFMSITGIKGDSTAAGHTGQIRLEGYDYAISDAISAGSGAGTGKASGQFTETPLSITKYVDSASPNLFAAAVKEQNLGTVEIDFYKTNAKGSQDAFYKIILSNAKIVKIHQGDKGANAEPMERVAFQYQKIEIQDQSSSSSSGGTPSTISWDISTNTAQ